MLHPRDRFCFAGRTGPRSVIASQLTQPALFLTVVATELNMLFLRTDELGLLAGPPIELSHEWQYGAFGLAWAGERFAVVHADVGNEPLGVTWLSRQ